MNESQASSLFHLFSLTLLNSKRVLVALFLFTLTSCETPCRQWSLDQYSSKYSCFESSRMTLPGSSTSSPLTISIIRTISGVRMYINLLQLPVPPDPTDLSKAVVTISDDCKSYQISVHRFEGGQRLLVPNEVSQQLIELLLNDQSFKISVGSYRSDIIPANFQKLYNTL